LNRKLLLLDLVLLVGVITAGWQVRERWMAQSEREMKLLSQRIRPIPPPAVAPIPVHGAARPAAYIDVAQRVLFAKDRSPDVIIDPVVEPPPPPVPPLPKAHGFIGFGGTKTVILSVGQKGEHRQYRPGEEVGDFKLLDVNETHILLEWNGLRILKKLEEITDMTPPQAQAAAAPAAPKQENIAPSSTVASSEPKEGPGLAMNAEWSACVPGDASPPGTVRNGMRKVVQSTPFGSSCRWVPVK
jgi:hypothetical protein